MQIICFYPHSRSPLQDIMNTPKFQLRKLQRQMIKERDYRDGLEKELASKLALIAQRGTKFNWFSHFSYQPFCALDSMFLKTFVDAFLSFFELKFILHLLCFLQSPILTSCSIAWIK